MLTPVLVYGDRSSDLDPRASIQALRARALQAGAALPGARRHEAIVELLLDAGAVAQGLLDERFAADGCDRWTPLSQACGELLRAAGEELCASMASRFSRRGALAPVGRSLQRLSALDLPRTISVRQPEGPAFYALHPELYALAAQDAAASLPAAVVIGVRSVGAPLAGVVAAALGDDLPMTVRPVGDPFARTLALDASVVERLRGAPCCAIVDEGPGMSGSSFAAVAERVAAEVPSCKLHFFPSHSGPPGPMATDAIRAAWERIPRTVCAFEEAFLGWGRMPGLSAWIEDLVGPPLEPLKDLSGGRWRWMVGGTQHPADLRHERRKYLARTRSGHWLLKFAGLGAAGRAALDRARRLSRAGWTPEVAGLRNGFLVQRWESDARPLPSTPSIGRAALVAKVADYIAWRARELPGGPGASLRELLDVALRNAGLALGGELSDRLRAWEPRLGELERRVRRCAIDGRMHAWEWLVSPSGALIKADAVDHCGGHDLIGCQDPGWDLAGASVELRLDATETRDLVGRFAERAHPSPPDLLELLRVCYLAFQLGRASLAADAIESWAPRDSELLRNEELRYADLLRASLSR